MKKIFIGIPVLNRIDLLEQCLDCIDCPADIVVLNNNTVNQGVNDYLERLKTSHNIRVINARNNLGVSASWNKLISLGMSWGHEVVYIGSNDSMLNPGALAKAQIAIEDTKDDMDAAMWYIMHWNFWAIHARTIPRVGLFDENYYPAYREDQDYDYRCRLAGMNQYNLIDAPAVYGSAVPVIIKGMGGKHIGSQTIHSDASYAALNRVTHNDWNSNHYVMKWGGLPPNETYKTPYNGIGYGSEDRDFRWWPDPGETIATRDWDKDNKRIRG